MKASFSSIQPEEKSNKKDHGAQYAMGLLKTIQEMKLIAKMKGGKCLSKIYIGANS